MAKTFKRSFKFAFKSSIFITAFLALLVSVFLYAFYSLNALFIAAFTLGCFMVSFFIIQYGVEQLIYKRVKKIYDDLTLLESSSFNVNQITTDMTTLTQEIERYAKNKKLEIEALKIREQYRKEFIGNVSHELKTPLFTVQGYISTLIDGAVEDETLREKYLIRAEKGVERLIYIIKDLDMITKFEAGDLSLDIESFDIVELVQSVFEQLEIKASKKKIALIFDKEYKDSIMVNGDRERLLQVVSNLIVNSIKYGQENGTTEVNIENLIKNKVIVRVTDNGEGIQKSIYLDCLSVFIV